MHIYSFIRVFAFPELRSIIKNKLSLVLIFLVMLLSLWAIGFSVASKQYLADRMESPFVTYLTIEIPQKIALEDEFEQNYTDSLSSIVNKKSFGIERFEFIPTYPLYFLDALRNTKSKSKSKLSVAQVTKKDDPFLAFIRDRKRDLLLAGNSSMAEYPWSIIVTVDFLAKLGYDVKNEGYPKFIEIDVDYINKDGGGFPIRVSGVVKRLPNKIDLLIKPKLYEALRNPDINQTPFNLSHPDHLNYKQFYFEHSDYSQINPGIIDEMDVRVFKDSLSHNNSGYGWIIEINDSISEEKLLDHCRRQKIAWTRIYDPTRVRYLEGERESIESSKKDLLMVEINDLNKVEVFENWCNKNNLALDMSDIENSNNFKLFSTLSNLLSLFLKSISIAFLIIILSRLIIEHINKNSKNLGTLKAFGLSNKFIIITYSSISAVIITVIFHFVYILVLLTGESISELLVLSQNTKTPPLFHLPLEINLYLYFVFIPIVVISLTLYNRIKNVTPGDLIFERE